MKKPQFSTRYVAHFRIGEIHFLHRDHVHALECFDRAETYYTKRLNDSDLLNHYFIMTRMALNYWVMGPEFLNLALKSIHKAADLATLLRSKSLLEPENEERINHNVCWYELEMFRNKWGVPSWHEDFNDKYKLDSDESLKRLKESESHWNSASTAYGYIKPSLVHPNVLSNKLDTAACYCFTEYQVKKANHDTTALASLRQSLEYCHKMVQGRSGPVLRVVTQMAHTYHVRMIQAAADHEGLTYP